MEVMTGYRESTRRLTGLAVGLAAAMLLVSPAPAAAQERIVPQSEAELRLSYAPIVREAAPAVVNIHTSRMVRRPSFSPFFDDPFFRHFFGDRGFGGRGQSERVQNSLGSGVIVDPAGRIVTNAHVIEGADEIRVSLADRREFPAEVVTTDESTDLAILRIGVDEPLPHLELADSDALEVGDIVLAIGNPFGIGQTVTSGIVSALKRNGLRRSGYEEFIQTDAPVNPGNSGGALVDSNGRLVGINTAFFSPNPANVGINLAVPSNMASAIMAQLIAYGEVRRGRIGITLRDLDPTLAGSLGLERSGGALVGRVAPGSSAAEAGIVQGDVIVAANGRPIRTATDLTNLVGVSPIGARLYLTLYRNGEEQEVEATIAPVEEPDLTVQAVRRQ
jgi:Do/DeqQ family serine protease